MQCPRCKKPGAFLFSEDGITNPGTHEVSIKHSCHDLEDWLGCGVEIATVTIQVIRKRGTTELLED